MKKIIAAAAFIAALATPALAQSYDPDIGSGNIARSGYANAYRGAYRAFARANHRAFMRHYRHFRR